MRINRLIGFNHKKNQSSGHEVHKNTIAYDSQGLAHPVIFKKNKFPGKAGEEASKLEACFSALANLCGKPQHALKQDIITTDDGHIAGIATEHASKILLGINHPSLPFAQSNNSSLPAVFSATEFNTWLQQIQAIESIESKWKKALTDEPLAHILIESIEQEIIQHEKRIERYFNERVSWSMANPFSDADLIDQLTPYCQEWIQAKQEFTVAKLPPELQCHAELARLIYDKEWLTYHSEKKIAANIQKMQEIASMDIGIGFNFLDTLPQNFFTHLQKAKDCGQVELDMDSLADLFTIAYGLEEDDLHKGNIGYYITLTNNNKPCFHFFKIDHDLMFANKLMSSRNGARINQLFYTNHYFAITARDLLDFPDIRASKNHYWPTRTSFFVNGSKAYQNKNERNAYKALNKDAVFQGRKWFCFLKQAVIPHELIQFTLKQPLNALNSEDETHATLSLIERAFSSRMTELQQVLLSIPEFRCYAKDNELTIRNTIMDEFNQYISTLGCSEAVRTAIQNASAKKLNTVFQVVATIQGTCTPLQAALLTKTYRCHETASLFSMHLHTKNATGQTPFEYALEQYHFAAFNQEEHLIHYYADVVCDLYPLQTAECKTRYLEEITQIKPFCSYNNLPCVSTLAEYKKEIKALRELPGSLKQDKVLAIHLLEKSHLSASDLSLLKKELTNPDHTSPLKFIKELRSELWIVKRIWGAYGNTSSYQQMNHIIQQQIDKLSAIPQNKDLPAF